ncbi:MAG: thiol:disulfide interchange protein DsbA/DsbL [Pseudomonadota bacterium]
MKPLTLLLALALSVVLAACGSHDGGPKSAAAPTDSATVPPPPTAAGPVTTEQLKKAATAAQESAGEETDPGDASLERLTAIPESAQLPGGRWKVGQHYLPVVPAQATSVEPGQVEVLEFFWLGCPHCYALEPYVEAWNKSKPAYVKFVGEHVMWGPTHRSHARLYYTLQVLGKADTLVPKAFEEIHRHNNMLVAADDAQSQRLQVAFAKANGISEADFNREYNGFAVNARLQRAEELMRRYKIETVPYFIINGKYQTDESMAGGKEQLIQLINDLAAAEKSH